MSRDDLLEMEGTVVEVLGGGNFRVKCDQGPSVLARLSGRMKRYHIRVVLGDRVKVGVSPYDLTHGFITYRS